MNPSAVDIIVTLQTAQGRKPVREVIAAQAQLLEEGATLHQLDWDRLRLTLSAMLIEDEKVSVGALIQRARSNPPQAYLDSIEVGRIGMGEDRYFERPIYEPSDYFPPADKDDRRRLDAHYAQAKLKPRDNGSHDAIFARVLDKIKASAA